MHRHDAAPEAAGDKRLPRVLLVGSPNVGKSVLFGLLTGRYVVVEPICTLLGHPRVCPHGKPIPLGKCCSSGRRDVGPVVERLCESSAGESGTVAYVCTTSPGRLGRLASFGLVPGTAIRVHQTWPSVVVTLGETELAFDQETSRDIFVRRFGDRSMPR